MAANIDDFKEVLRKGIRNLMASDLEAIESSLWDVIEELIDAGELETGPDHSLSGRFLEAEVRSTFRKMGFDVSRGPKGEHDAKVEPPSGFDPEKPCVVEVKSSAKRAGPNRRDLRQLDDWVYELSDEKEARKQGLGGKADTQSIATGGWFPPTHHHPTPHKGVMVFNGPVGMPFDQRPRKCLGANEEEFAQKRDFCIIPFGSLLEWAQAIERESSLARQLWGAMHACAGELAGPNERT